MRVGLRLPFWIFTAWLTLIFLLGGSSRADLASLLTIRPLSALLLAYGLAGLRRAQARQFAVPLLLALAWLALTVLQLVPLPPAIWRALPGHAIVAEIDREVGLVDVWRPISLVPPATRNAAFSLLAPIATMLLAMRLDEKARAKLPLVVALLGLASALLGVLQILGDPHGPLYLYEPSNYGLPVGLFANRNHQATFLACTIAVLAVGVPRFDRIADRRLPLPDWLAPFLVAVPIFILVMLTGSRTGTVLALCGMLIMPLLLPAPPPQARAPTAAGAVRVWLLPFSVAAIAVLAVAFDRATSFQRFIGLDAGQDMRLRALPVVREMIGIYSPWGIGFGAFPDVFQMHEPDGLLSRTYRNHVHNDWLELVLTGGVPAAILALVSLALLARQAIRVLIVRDRRAGGITARLGIVVLTLFGLASLTDYPLRMPSLMCFAALAVFWIFCPDLGHSRPKRANATV